jgi:Aspartyl protease
VRLRLIVPSGPIRISALVDSGADHSVFRASLLEEPLGFGSGDLVPSEVTGAGGATPTRRLSIGDLTAELADVPSEAFSLRGEFSDLVPFHLLGRWDFFSVFDVAFYEASQEFHLRDRRV